MRMCFWYRSLTFLFHDLLSDDMLGKRFQIRSRSRFAARTSSSDILETRKNHPFRKRNEHVFIVQVALSRSTEEVMILNIFPKPEGRHTKKYEKEIYIFKRHTFHIIPYKKYENRDMESWTTYFWRTVCDGLLLAVSP